MANKTTYEVDLILKAQNKIGWELKELAKQVNKIEKETNEAWKEFKELWKQTKKTASTIWSDLRKLWWIIAWVFVVKQVIWFGVELFNLAWKLEVLDKKAKIVFWDFIWQVEQVAEESASSLWLTQTEFVNASASVWDLLIPMWFARKEATKMSTDITMLSWALSEWTWWTRTATEVNEILAKAMLWERDSLVSLWVKISEIDVQGRLLAKWMDKLTWKALEQAKWVATLELIYEKSTDAQTAFKEWWGSLVRQQAELGASLKSLKESLAKSLIPAFTKLLKKYKPLIEKNIELAKEWLENEDNINKFAKSIDEALIILDAIIITIGDVIWFLWEMKEMFKFVWDETTIWAESVWKDIFKLKEWFKNLWEKWDEMWDSIVHWVLDLMKEWFIIWWTLIWETIAKIKIKFSELIKDAKKWGANLIQEFIDWIGNKAEDLWQSVLDLAKKIENFLGFSSPTKKWPWKNADKWIPNMFKMFKTWFTRWEIEIWKAASRIALVVNDWINRISVLEIKDKLLDFKIVAWQTFDDLWIQIQSQKKVVGELVDEYKDLKDSVSDIDEQIADIAKTWLEEIAWRAVGVQDELKWINIELKANNKELEDSKKNYIDWLDITEKEKDALKLKQIWLEKELNKDKELLELKKKKLETELNTAKQFVSQEDIQQARLEAESSITEKIFFRMAARIREAQEEKKRFTELIEAKKELIKWQIKTEADNYKTLVDLKKQLDSDYFKLFWEHVQKQSKSVEDIILKMQDLTWWKKWLEKISTPEFDRLEEVNKRETWWPVISWSPYIVGEKWPELFVPSSSWSIIPNNDINNSVNINMWWVSVRNESDINKIVNMLTRKIQLKRTYNIA